MPSVLSPEMEARDEWSEIIRPLAREIISTQQHLGIHDRAGNIVNAAVATYIYFADHWGKSLICHPDGPDDENYSGLLESKFSGMRMTGLAEHFEWLGVKVEIFTRRLLQLAVKRFLRYAAVNRVQAAELIFLVEDLCIRDNPTPHVDKIEITLPEWLLGWCNEDKRPGETESEFIAGLVRESVLRARGLN